MFRRADENFTDGVSTKDKMVSSGQCPTHSSRDHSVRNVGFSLQTPENGSFHTVVKERTALHEALAQPQKFSVFQSIPKLVHPRKDFVDTLRSTHPPLPFKSLLGVLRAKAFIFLFLSIRFYFIAFHLNC